jgi:membrane-associated phospholipid phosphatase
MCSNRSRSASVLARDDRVGTALGEWDRRLFRRVAVASLLANQVGKRVLPRVRPLLESVPAGRRARTTPGLHSFPSGHAASAAAFAVGASAQAPALAVPLGVTAAAVGFSQVYTGVHYPVDVLAGVVLGAGVAVAVRRSSPLAPDRRPRTGRHHARTGRHHTRAGRHHARAGPARAGRR